MVFKSFSFDLGNSTKITTDIIFRSKSPKFRSKSPKFRSEFTEISFFEFEFSFRSELAKFGEISAEISFPANGGIRKKNEKVNPGWEWAASSVNDAQEVKCAGGTGRSATQIKQTVSNADG